MGLVEQVRFIRSEIADDVLISAVISMALVDIWMYTLITAGWLKNRIEKREERIRNEGRDEGREEVLAILDDDARKEAERKLRRNGNPETRN